MKTQSLSLLSNDILADVKQIVLYTREFASAKVNLALLQRNWFLGRRIALEEMKGECRAEHYGDEIIVKLADQLTRSFGKGFAKTNLYCFVQFYKLFPKIFHAVSGKSQMGLLSWTHYRTLLRVEDESAREWYAQEAFSQAWSSRTLDRNISTQYYYRMLASQKNSKISNKQKGDKPGKLEFLKNPMVAEFLDLPTENFTESELEKSIITHLQKFIMELGKGFAFVARQQHIFTDTQDYFIDLVFYNYMLKCFVLVDLKTGVVCHQDIGQMDMYVRMYDEQKRCEGDNPTIGIVLGSETSEDIAKYSVLHGSEQLFQAKYMAYMPTPEILKNEIEKQKKIFWLDERKMSLSDMQAEYKI